MYRLTTAIDFSGKQLSFTLPLPQIMIVIANLAEQYQDSYLNHKVYLVEDNGKKQTFVFGMHYSKAIGLTVLSETIEASLL